MTKTWKRTAVAGVAALSLFGAACGDDDESAGSSGDVAADESGSEDTTSEDGGTSETSSEMMTEDDPSEGTATAGPTGPACGAVPTDGEGSFDGMADDPAATAASNNPELSTLVSAVQQAGLVETLNGEGPFTIFAPVNSAFAKIPAGDMSAVMADNELLTSILTLHVVQGEELDAEALAQTDSVTTVNGADITIEAEGDSVTVNGMASVVCANIPTDNATVHLIDSVLMPEA